MPAPPEVSAPQITAPEAVVVSLPPFVSVEQSRLLKVRPWFVMRPGRVEVAPVERMEPPVRVRP